MFKVSNPHQETEPLEPVDLVPGLLSVDKVILGVLKVRPAKS